MKPIVIGDGEKVEKQSVSADKEVLPNSKVLLLTNGNITMPDMKGWTKEDVIAFERLANVKIETKGSGFVNEQSVSEGQQLKKNDKIEVKFEGENVDSEAK